MLRRGFLQVHDVTIVLLVAQQPSKPQGRLQLAVDHRGPAARIAFTRIASGDERIFRSVAVARVHREAEIRVKGQQKGTIIIQPYTVGQRAVLHKV